MVFHSSYYNLDPVILIRIFFISNINPFQRLDECNEFIDCYKQLWQPPYFANFPDSLDCLPEEWVGYLRQLSLADKFMICQFKSDKETLPSHMPESFKKFILKMVALAEVGSFVPQQKEDIFEDPIFKQQIFRLEYKKLHEIKKLTPSISELQEKFSSDVMIDVGGGKSFLALALSGMFKKQVVLDSNQALLEKCKGYYQRWKRPYSPICHCLYIEDERFLELLHDDIENSLMTGLHLCGNLTNVLLKGFVKSKAKALVSLGCCFHRLEESDQNLSGLCKHTLSASEFRLALVPYHFRSYETFLNNDIKNHYRFALYAIIFELTGKHPEKKYMNDFIYPRRANSFDFRSFLEINQKEIGLTYSIDALMGIYHEKGKEKAYEMEIFEFARRCMSRVTECYLVYDRLAYLLQSGLSADLFEVFDGRISPRNLAIFAHKQMINDS